MGLKFLGRIPFDPKVVLCGDTGACYSERNTDSAVTKAFDDVAARMSGLA
jgi:ATP-binding protein involved in chromosome partitioning